MPSYTPEQATDVPKILWVLWWQGLDEAPPIVRQCVGSWANQNPTWEVRVLDNGSAKTYADISEFDSLAHHTTPQVRANLLRLKLLELHGGVWADASCYCVRPLDSWLGRYTQSGFFAFSDPYRTRPISNWFLASMPNNYIIKTLRKRYAEFFQENEVSLRGRNRYAAKALSLVLDRVPGLTGLWFHPMVTRGLKVYPYFCFHYMFAQLAAQDPKFGATWRQTKDFPAKDAHLIQHFGQLEGLHAEVRKAVDSSSVPLFKLNWRVARTELDPSTNIGYLLSNNSVE